MPGHRGERTNKQQNKGTGKTDWQLYYKYICRQSVVRIATYTDCTILHILYIKEFTMCTAINSIASTDRSIGNLLVHIYRVLDRYR